MSGSGWMRIASALAGLLGAFLVVTGLIRLLDDRPGAGGPVARLALGAVLVAAAALVLWVATRRRPVPARGADAASRASAAAETRTCPACGAANPQSLQHCHACDQALR